MSCSLLADLFSVADAIFLEQLVRDLSLNCFLMKKNTEKHAIIGGDAPTRQEGRIFSAYSTLTKAKKFIEGVHIKRSTQIFIERIPKKGQRKSPSSPVAPLRPRAP